MGRWGVGNFEDDGAMDYVGNLVGRLATAMTEILTDEERAALAEEGEAVAGRPMFGLGIRRQLA
jgi:hypothetical protein